MEKPECASCSRHPAVHLELVVSDVFRRTYRQCAAADRLHAAILAVNIAEDRRAAVDAIKRCIELRQLVGGIHLLVLRHLLQFFRLDEIELNCVQPAVPDIRRLLFDCIERSAAVLSIEIGFALAVLIEEMPTFN